MRIRRIATRRITVGVKAVRISKRTAATAAYKTIRRLTVRVYAVAYAARRLQVYSAVNGNTLRVFLTATSIANATTRPSGITAVRTASAAAVPKTAFEKQFGNLFKKIAATMVATSSARITSIVHRKFPPL